VEAKNDLATMILPSLVRQGMTLRTNTVCVRLVRTGSRIRGVECVNTLTGERETILGSQVLLAAGSLATPHLLLASNLTAVSTAPQAIGRFLTRHRNEFVLGLHPRLTNPEGVFDKHVAIFDQYESAGCIQQMTMPVALVQAALPWFMRAPASISLARGIGLLAIAEDQPRQSNGVSIDWSSVDRFGLPLLRVHHRYTARDEAAVAQLVRLALRIQREAGAWFSVVQPVKTFSHALGTVRMGKDPTTSPLDELGRFRGLDNLFVVDGSVMPRSGGVNPSLTIAANALRVGAHVARPSSAVIGASRGSRALRTLATL
jgi:choline dehydrogenase-like flavoprotein